MRLPRTYRDLLSEKMSFMARQEVLLSRDIVRYQDKVLSDLIRTLYDTMDVTGGVIQDTAHNYRVMGQINRTLREVEAVNAEKIASRIGKATDRIDQFNLKQFGVAIGASAKLERVASLASGRMDNRLGYVSNRLVRGGFLANVLSTDEIAAQANTLITKSVTAQVKMSDMVRDLTELIDGGERMGLMERKMDRLAFDVYQQYDAAYGEQLAEQFDMNYFIYQGGLVEDSRDFCREHNGRVWSREEAEEWGVWTPSKAQFIRDFKQKDIYSVPSYIDYPGYQPLIDRGGYNCRHAIGWISDELAFRMRPGLKEGKPPKPPKDTTPEGETYEVTPDMRPFSESVTGNVAEGEIHDIIDELNAKMKDAKVDNWFGKAGGFTGNSFYMKFRGKKIRISDHATTIKWGDVYGYSDLEARIFVGQPRKAAMQEMNNLLSQLNILKRQPPVITYDEMSYWRGLTAPPKVGQLIQTASTPRGAPMRAMVLEVGEDFVNVMQELRDKPTRIDMDRIMKYWGTTYKKKVEVGRS